jgi:hypothetical protein
MKVLSLVALVLLLSACAAHTPRLPECHGKATPINPVSSAEVPHGARSSR